MPNQTEWLIVHDLSNWRLALCWLQTVITPLEAVTALPSAILIIAIMPSVSISVKARLFYVTVTVYNLLSLVVIHILNNFVDNVLHFLTNGTFYFYFESLSPLACKFSRFLDGVGEGGSSYTLALFAFERYIVIHHGNVKSVSKFTTKRSVICLGIVHTLVVMLNATAYLIYDRKEHDEINSHCSPLVSWLVVCVVFSLNTILPNCALVIMTLLVFKSVRARHNLMRNMRTTSCISSKGKSTTLILLLIASIHCLLYVPASLTYVLYASSRRYDENFASRLRLLSNAFSTFLGFLSTADFIVFVCKLDDFRRRIRRALLYFCTRSSSPCQSTAAPNA